MAGMGFFGHRAFTREKQAIEQVRLDAAARAAAEAERARAAAEAETPVKAAQRECREAIAASEVSKVWKTAETLCRERIATFSADPVLRQLALGIQCRDWREQVERGTEVDQGMRRELHSWILRDCKSVFDGGVRLPTEWERCRTRLDELRSTISADPDAAQKALDELWDTCRSAGAARRLEEQIRKERASRAADDCRKMDSSEQSAFLLLRCSQYAALSYCPELKELQVPKGKKLMLTGALGARGWRPTDALLLRLLRSYGRDFNGQGSWVCNGEEVTFVPGRPAVPR
jgi:hypothetical protein